MKSLRMALIKIGLAEEYWHGGLRRIVLRPSKVGGVVLGFLAILSLTGFFIQNVGLMLWSASAFVALVDLVILAD